jgi:hypothetical protein
MYLLHDAHQLGSNLLSTSSSSSCIAMKKHAKKGQEGNACLPLLEKQLQDGTFMPSWK